MQSSKINFDLRKFIVPTIPQAVFFILVVFVVWFTDLFMQFKAFVTLNEEAVSSWNYRFFDSIPVFSSLLSLVLTAINAFFISQLNNRYSIIRTRTFLPVLFFIVLVASWHNTHTLVLSHLVLMLYLVALYVFFGIYRNRNAAEKAYTSSMLVAAASLIYYPIILFVIVFWIGLAIFYSFSVRTFLASVLGVLTPLVLFAAIKVYIEPDLNWLFLIGQSFELGMQIASRPLNELIYLGLLILVVIFGLVGVFKSMNQDSMQTRALINFNMIILLFSFACSLVFIHMFFVFLPIVAMSYSIILSHAITTRKTDFYKIVFIIFIVLNLVYVVSNLILHPL